MKIEQDRNLPPPVYRAQVEEPEGNLNLGQVLAALYRKIYLIGGVTVIVSSLAIFKALTDTPIYSAKFEILTQPITAENQVISTIPGTLTSQEAEASAGIVDDNTLKVLTSPVVISPIFDQLKDRYPDLSEATLAENLAVTSAFKSNSKVLVVSYQNQDSDRVKNVLDVVAKTFLNYSLKSRQADIRQGIDFVQIQLPEQQRRVARLQQQLQQLREQYKLVDPNSRGEQLSQQLATFSQQQLDTQVELKQLRAMEAALAQQLATRPNQSAGSSALSNAPRYQTLLDQLLQTDNQIAQSSILYQETSPEMQYYRQQRQKLLSLLSQEGERVQFQIQDRIQELEARNQALVETISSLKGNITELSGISRKYADIQQELNIATENLNQFLSKQAALEIDAAQRKSPWELLTPTTAPTVSVSSVRRNLLQGIILGLLLGSGIALALDKLSNVLHSSKDIKQLTKLPILGVIPFNTNLTKPEPLKDAAAFSLKVDDSSKPFGGITATVYTPEPFIESFRFLYTNINRFNPDSPLRSLVVSSPSSSDGKSTVALYLAQAAANIGQRVLLVDADLRRPKLHRYIELNNRGGLTDVIAGDASPGNMLQQSLLDPNLFVLTTGSIPPDPTKFLSSRKMKLLMEKSPELFDLVIYDTPPLLNFVDTSLIAPHSDGMILVAGLGKLKTSLLEQALEQLKVSGIPVLGIVANGSRESVPSIQEVYQRYSEREHNELLPKAEDPALTNISKIPVPSFLESWKLDQ